MKKPLLQKTNSAERRGAMLVLIVICLPIILMFAAFAINVAWMQMTRTQLRTATDSAVRAASRTKSLTQDSTLAREAAKEAASRNIVAGTPMLLSDADVVFGSSTEDAISGSYGFTSTHDDDRKITGVRVTGSRTSGSASGSIPMLFQGMFDTGTFEPVKTAVATHIDRDVVLVLDRSGSMGYPTRGGNRYRDLRVAVNKFLIALQSTPQSEQVGVVTYSSSATKDEKLSEDYLKIQRTVDSRRIYGGTAIGLGMQAGLDVLLDKSTARKTAAKTLVVMTDGQHNRSVSPETVANQAAAKHVVVHTITFGAGAEKGRMKKVAKNGRGQHWHADDQGELIEVFEEIAANLPTLITE